MHGATASPPLPTTDAITKFLLPRHRGSLPDMRVVGQFVPQMLSQYMQSLPRGIKAEPGGVRIEYTVSGRPFEEEICAIGLRWDTSDVGPMGVVVQHNWQLHMPFGMRAAKGTLEAKRALFARILGSARVNPQWVTLSGQVQQQLQQTFNAWIQQGYDAINAAGAASRQISANNDAMLAGMQAQREQQNAAWQQQRAQQRAQTAADEYSSHDAFSDYMRSQNTYEDPYWGTSKHSNEFEYVWTDGAGNYKFSNEAGYDPNVGSTQSWQIMRRVG
jgi:hypothetical protein